MFLYPRIIEESGLKGVYGDIQEKQSGTKENLGGYHEFYKTLRRHFLLIH
jgi:hypothetical protein